MSKRMRLPILLATLGVLVLLALGAGLFAGRGTRTLAFRVSDIYSLPETERDQCIPLFLPPPTPPQTKEPKPDLAERATGIQEIRAVFDIDSGSNRDPFGFRRNTP